jgi:hypothetical protein
LRNHIWELAIPTYTKVDVSNITEGHKAARQHARVRRAARENQLGAAHSGTGLALVQRERERARFYNADVKAFLKHFPGWTEFTPQITQVCSALRSETLRLFYGSNIFQLRTNNAMRTSNAMDFTDMMRWASTRPQIGLNAMRQIAVEYVKGNILLKSIRLHLLLYLSRGVAVGAPLSDCAKGVPWGVLCFFRLGDNWPAGSVVTVDDDNDFFINLPAAILAKKNEETKRLCGFGDAEEEMTHERLMKIVKAFNFYTWPTEKAAQAALQSREE